MSVGTSASIFPVNDLSFSPKAFINLETVYTIRRSDKMLLNFKEFLASLNPAALLQVEEGNRAILVWLYSQRKDWFLAKLLGLV